MTHTGRPCQAHEYHSPRPADRERHHVWPLGWQGPEHPSNVVAVCPTGHRNIHVLLEFYKDFNGSVPWPIRREFGPGERKIAAEGWRRYVSSTSSHVEPTHDVAASEQQL